VTRTSRKKSKTNSKRNSNLKFALLGAVATLALVIANGCNSVKFTKNEGACTVDNPCLQPNGLYGFSQSLTFTTTKKVDILIVNDNSGSMSQEQASLANPFNGFINNLNTAGVDWQVAVTNTDVCPVAGGSCWTPKGITGAQGKFMGPADGSGRQPDYGNYILTPSTPDVVNTFSRTIQRGSEVGAGDERGIYAANLAIDLAKTSNSGFFRDNSELAVVILSDEDERTTGGNCSPPDATKPSVCDPGYFPMEPYDLPQTLMNKVVTTFGGKKSFLVHSIVIKPEDSACLAVQQSQGPFFTAHYGNTYSELSTLAKNRSVVEIKK
jgi:hypothetical protein